MVAIVNGDEVFINSILILRSCSISPNREGFFYSRAFGIVKIIEEISIGKYNSRGQISPIVLNAGYAFGVIAYEVADLSLVS
ncbi:MAG: hypothetical protein SFU91_08290 [Chloroherpetonaceae bacterium]|nr:hypothetical protein [Chloroherpetonaceae bacterium]